MNPSVPTPRQLEFLDWEYGVFLHFGIRTFYEGHQDWDNIHMDAKGFCPTELNCEQWAKAIVDAGAHYAILTAKHHDGFALWPSAYTDYSVAASPWKDGKGDVVREFTDACRKFGLKVGIYYSPAQFGYRDMNGTEYDDYFIHQISELLSNYGKIDYLWFDGCGSDGHEYDKARIVKVIRSLQPEILIFNMWDPDTRWVGNEEGFVPLHTPYAVLPDEFSIYQATEPDTPRFLPYECDFRIRKDNWFYSEKDADRLRTLEDLENLYLRSVGRGGNFLVNVGPDRRGLLPEADCERLLELRRVIEQKYTHPIPCTVIPKDHALEIRADAPTYCSSVILRENLEQGQKVTAYRILFGAFQRSLIDEGDYIGHKRICPIGPFYLDSLRYLEVQWDGDAEVTVELV